MDESRAPTSQEPRGDTRLGNPQQFSDLQQLSSRLAGLAGELYRRGWLDGATGDLSARPPGSGRMVLTPKGRSRADLAPADFVLADIADRAASGPADPDRPETHTALHATLYRAFPDCQAVVYAQAPYATAVGALADRVALPQVLLSDFEILSAFGAPAGSPLRLPILASAPSAEGIAAELGRWLKGWREDSVSAVLIAYGGAVTWGPSLESARNRMESLEAACRLHLLTRR